MIGGKRRIDRVLAPEFTDGLEEIDLEERRRRDGDEGTLLELVAAILADAPTGSSRGEAPVFTIPDEEINLARRRVERLVSDSRLSDLPALADEELEEAVQQIDEEERNLSDLRARVLQVHDTLQAELVRKWRDRLSGMTG